MADLVLCTLPQETVCFRGCSFYSSCHLKPQTSPIQQVSLIPKCAGLKFSKSEIDQEKGTAQALREILNSSATEQISFLKENIPREHLRDKDRKSTHRPQSQYVYPQLVTGFLKIALRVEIPLSLCPKKAKKLSEGSGHFSLKPDPSCEVTASPEIKGNLSKGGPHSGTEAALNSLFSFTAVWQPCSSIMVGPLRKLSVIYRRK